MKKSFISLIAVLHCSTAILFAQSPVETRAITQEEYKALLEQRKQQEAEIAKAEEEIKKLFEERDRILSKPQVIYYSPVLDPTGQRMAYLKRTVEYRLKGGGLIPFFSDAPEVTWISDSIELRKRDLKTKEDDLIIKWDLPKPHYDNAVGGVFVKLEWSEKIFYDIHLSSYEKIVIAGDSWCRGSGFCLSNKDGRVTGVSSIKGITVDLEYEMESARYPVSNNLIVKQTHPGN